MPAPDRFMYAEYETRWKKRVLVVPKPVETRVEALSAMTMERPVAAQNPRITRAARWEPITRACAELTPILTETLQQFWGVPVRAVFLGAGTRSHYFWRMDDFHVSQLTLAEASLDMAGSEAAMAVLKLSDVACATFLDRVLGSRQAPFSFKRLSPLEATILNELSRDLLACLKKNLISKPKKTAQNKVVHLIWTLRPEVEGTAPAEVGKIVLSLPMGAIRTQKALRRDMPETQVPDEFFFHVNGPARIYLGSTRVTLADLDHLEPEDLIVLEDSHTSRMFVVEPLSGERIPFQSQIQQHSQLTIPYTQELASMDTQQDSQGGNSARQTLWDNLMIEVGAEFEPVRLPLKHLKEMTEGLIVEMGDLVHNRVCLRVEGKTLAWGELVIVGDKFGVRVCQVEAAGQPSNSAVALVGHMEAPHEMPVPVPHEPMPEAAPAENAEEANVDNFLNEDFDETFDDDEEDW